MNLENIRLLYFFSFIVLGLIIFLPTLFILFPLPEAQGFSEFWLLGSNNMIEDGRLNVLMNEEYTVFLGVSNQMSSLEYYRVHVKLLSESESLQEIGRGFPVSQESLFEYRFVLSSNETWEKNFTFNFEDVSFDGNIAVISALSINGNDINMSKILIQDNSNNEFHCQFVFELWIFNSALSVFQFHNHFVGLWINI